MQERFGFEPLGLVACLGSLIWVWGQCSGVSPLSPGHLTSMSMLGLEPGTLSLSAQSLTLPPPSFQIPDPSSHRKGPSWLTGKGNTNTVTICAVWLSMCGPVDGLPALAVFWCLLSTASMFNCHVLSMLSLEPRTLCSSAQSLTATSILSDL